MRRFLIVAVFALALFGMVAPPVFAQAPTPTVTITGLFDQVTSAGKNFYDGNYARNNDREWYARTRFRPDFVFQVGRTKAVMGLEIDLQYGQAGNNGGSGPGKGTTIPNDQIIAPGTATAGAGVATYPGTKAGTTADAQLNNDVTGVIELKWFYTEFDLTGKDSLLPFIPVLTVARAGGQPFGTLTNYKTAAFTSGDFAGISAVTTFAPNLKTNLAFVIVEDELAGGNRNGFIGGSFPNVKWTRGEDYAVIFSPEFTPFKGLDIKPMYNYFRADGLTSSQARRSATNRMSVGGNIAGAGAYAASAVANPAGNPGPYAAGVPTLHENRHTVGVDAMWRWGGFGLDPTIFYQFGSRETQCVSSTGGLVKRCDADVAAWLVDVVGSWQAGPLLLELRGIYSTGNSARDNLAKSIRYFEVLDADTSYYTGWAQIWALGVDYFNGAGGSNGGMSTNIGYDRYGRAQVGLRATYNLTPALAVYGVASPTWTAKKVDTDTGVSGTTRTILNDTSFVKGDSSYLGTEADLGLTWRFAPNVAFDLVGAYLWAGGALKVTEILNGVQTRRDAQDAWTAASRVRLSF